MKYKKGQTYPIIRGEGKTYKAHIVAIVDKNYVVFKWYGRHKQWWHYEVCSEYSFDTEVKSARHWSIHKG